MLSPEIQKYADDHSNAADPVLYEVERSTHLHTLAPQMLTGTTQGAFLSLLTSLSGARHVLEIGTFTAYGSICLARGLNPAPESRVVTIDIDPEYEWLVKKHIELSGLDHRIETIVGNALEIIPTRDETWDLVYIDAHKQEYIAYYNAVIDRVRPGGLIVADNVLWSGKVIHEPEDVDARVLREYNDMVRDDPRVDVMLLTIRDGISIARKK